jgi:hypothetical protein
VAGVAAESRLRLRAAEPDAAHVLHEAGIRVPAGERVEVGVAEPAQTEPLGLEDDAQ